MSDLANYSESKMYDWATGRASPPAAGTRYLALFTAITDAEAGTGTEVAAAGYARQAVAFTADTDGAGDNSGVIEFGPITGAGGTVVGVALFDAVAAGNPITKIKAPTGGSIVWVAGNVIRFPVGSVDFAMA